MENANEKIEEIVEVKQKSPLERFLKSIWNDFLMLINLRNPTLRESLNEVIEEHDDGGKAIPAEEKELIQNVLSFSELTVEDIMVPRADIVHVNYDITLQALKKDVSEAAHTRIPVCRGNLDDVVGFLHIKDLVPILSGTRKFVMDEVIRQILFVPPSMKLTEVLLRMRAARVHIALVVDEYGGTSGVVTLEDIIEEIFGEIQDEHDPSEEEIMLIEQDDGVYEASARIEIDALEIALDTTLRKPEDREEYDTLGGMIFTKTGRIPSRGEVIDTENYEFQILDADPRRVKRVLIKKKQA